MIHWLWLLLIVPAALYAGFIVAALCGTKRAFRLQQELAATEDERRHFADALRKKCLEAENLKRALRKAKREAK